VPKRPPRTLPNASKEVKIFFNQSGNDWFAVSAPHKEQTGKEEIKALADALLQEYENVVEKQWVQVLRNPLWCSSPGLPTLKERNAKERLSFNMGPGLEPAGRVTMTFIENICGHHQLFWMVFHLLFFFSFINYL